MIYLDYSATTPVNSDVMDSYINCCKNYIGNPNSLHKLGVESKNIIDKATEQIKDILNINEYDVIYTSGASESNNTVIKGIASTYKNRGMRILTTQLEHSSIYGPLGFLQKQGFVVDIIETDNNGIVDINDLQKKLGDDVILVTISHVNSETGIVQPIHEIGKILKEYNKCYFHVDMTQSIGKIKVDFDNIDFASFSAHKFYGMKGIGCLIKKKKIVFNQLIHGGKSTTNFRSGTPPLALIVSTSKALRLAYQNLEIKYNHVLEINNYIKENLNKYDDVTINSNNSCIPHILNISTLNIKPEVMLHALENYDIYISTQSACSSNTQTSKAVYEITKDENRANHSLRISISHLTTFEDAKKFIECFNLCYNSLNFRRNI